MTQMKHTEITRTIQPDVSQYIRSENRFIAAFQSLRPLHWIKNIFVFVALLFSTRLFHLQSVIDIAAVFVIFCLSASAIYLINDLFDRNEDRLHPVKRFRPVTSGKITPKQALILSSFLILLTAILTAWIKPVVWTVIAAYIILNIAYSWFLKHWVVIDVMTIAIGFLMRIYAGSLALGYDLSFWVYLTVFLLSALIAFSKRRYEIIYNGESISGERGYTPYLLDMFMIFTGASLFSSYVFYILFRSNWQNGWTIYLSMLVVFFGITRYLYVIYQTREVKEHTRLMLSDKPLVISVLIWTVLWITEIYFVNPYLTY